MNFFPNWKLLGEWKGLTPFLPTYLPTRHITNVWSDVPDSWNWLFNICNACLFFPSFLPSGCTSTLPYFSHNALLCVRACLSVCVSSGNDGAFRGWRRQIRCFDLPLRGPARGGRKGNLLCQFGEDQKKRVERNRKSSEDDSMSLLRERKKPKAGEKKKKKSSRLFSSFLRIHGWIYVSCSIFFGSPLLFRNTYSWWRGSQ